MAALPALPPWAMQLGATPEGLKSFLSRQQMGRQSGAAGIRRLPRFGTGIAGSPAPTTKPPLSGPAGGGQGPIYQGGGTMKPKSDLEIQTGIDDGTMSTTEAVSLLDARKAGVPTPQGPPGQVPPGGPRVDAHIPMDAIRKNWNPGDPAWLAQMEKLYPGMVGQLQARMTEAKNAQHFAARPDGSNRLDVWNILQDAPWMKAQGPQGPTGTNPNDQVPIDPGPNDEVPIDDQTGTVGSFASDPMFNPPPDAMMSALMQSGLLSKGGGFGGTVNVGAMADTGMGTPMGIDNPRGPFGAGGRGGMGTGMAADPVSRPGGMTGPNGEFFGFPGGVNPGPMGPMMPGAYTPPAPGSKASPAGGAQGPIYPGGGTAKPPAPAAVRPPRLYTGKWRGPEAVARNQARRGGGAPTATLPDESRQMPPRRRPPGGGGRRREY